MFNKNNNIKEMNKIEAKLFQEDNIIFSSSFVNMIHNYHYTKDLQEQMDYQNDITSYVNKKNEYNIKKQYNPIIVNLYRDGTLIINNEKYQLKDFYIVFNDYLNNFHLRSKNSKFNIENDDYNKAIKLIDSTAFINLINNPNTIVHNNQLIINDISILNDTISKWDGYLHSEIEETDVISNKKMIEDDINE